MSNQDSVSTHKPQSSNMDMVNAVKEALTAMKLDTVGEDIRRSTDEMTRITEMVTNIQQKQNDLQKSLDFTQREYDTTKTKVNTLTLEISKSQHQSRIEFQENRVTELQKTCTTLKQQLVEAQYHSMKDNITISGIPEDRNENTKSVVIKFFKEVMKIPDSCFTINNLDTASDTDVVWIKKMSSLW